MYKMENIQFVGGWSYTQKEMNELFEFIDLVKLSESEHFNILEFGSGDSSVKLANIFSKSIKNLTYYTYESNSNYIQCDDRIRTILYNENDIENVNLVDNINIEYKFDLILVDGPNGNNRKFWYGKFKHYVKPGTIILVDDFNHYSSFGEELDKHFEYELLSFSNEPFVPNGEHSWKIVRIKNVNYELSVRKTFNDIYENNKWEMGQSETKSGLGSTMKSTENIRKYLLEFIRENHIKNMLDTSCGDWNWMKTIKNQLCNYTGVDVVEHIINMNNDKYSSDNIKFVNGDFLTFIKNIPEKQSYDLIFCRHTLEHLTTEYNIDFLNECKRVCKYLFVTGYNEINRQNTQLPDTVYRPINLELEPYLSILTPYYYTKIYDASYDPYASEAYMYVYKFYNLKVLD